MKVGDIVPVNIGSAVVAQGKVTALDDKEETVTIVIPATKIVASYKRELDLHAEAPQSTDTTGTTHAILGVEETPQVQSSNPEVTLNGDGSGSTGPVTLTPTVSDETKSEDHGEKPVDENGS